jgi:hypothetical protein
MRQITFKAMKKFCWENRLSFKALQVYAADILLAEFSAYSSFFEDLNAGSLVAIDTILTTVAFTKANFLWIRKGMGVT